MADVDSGFAELEDFVGSMLLSLEGAQQKKLLGHISQTMRRSHQRRIAIPDQSRWIKICQAQAAQTGSAAGKSCEEIPLSVWRIWITTPCGDEKLEENGGR